MSEQLDQRLHGLDAVRALALVAGVVLHGAMAFFPGPQMWLVDDVSHSTTLSVAFFVIHMARMTVFFVLAGYFGRLMYHRLGATAFVGNRLKRIGVPLIVAWPLVFASIVAVMLAGAPEGASGGAALTAEAFPLTHLWFLYVLLLLYAGTLVVRGAVAAIDRGGAIRALLDSGVGGLMHPWAVVLLALPVTYVLYKHPYWYMWFGVPTPDSGFVPNVAAITTYGLAFGLGWMVQRQSGTLLPRIQKYWALHLGLALAATVYCLATTSLTPLLAPAPFGGAKLRYAAAYAVGLWSWAFALLGIGLRFLNAPSPSRRYQADASYWIYLAHLPLVIGLQYLMRTWALPWPMKFALLIGITMTVLLLTYRWFVRPTAIGALLNGRRYPRTRRTSSSEGTILMKSLPLLLLLPTMLQAQRVAAPSALPLDTVVARYTAAIGPFQRVQTRRVSMRVTGMAPFEIPVVMEAMRPNLLLKKVSIQGAEQVTGYDGRAAWRVDPFASSSKKAIDVPAAELADLMEETDFDGPLVNATTKGNRLRYLGPRVVAVAGAQTPVHAVELTMASGRQSVVHLHATTYLEVLRTQTRPVMGSDVAMTITPSDYRVVQGVKVPHLTEIAIAGMPEPIRLKIDRVEFGVVLNRAQFARP